jgi:hypothetical protein
LVELQQQLAETERLDPALREELRGAMAEIRARIEAGEEVEPSLADRVRELMLRFDAAHPSLAEAIGAVARALARIGI